MDAVEILFVIDSSKDRRGRRVLIREGRVENCLWPEDKVADMDSRLLGLSERQRRQIEKFLKRY
jgi:hypothetical protein